MARERAADFAGADDADLQRLLGLRRTAAENHGADGEARRDAHEGATRERRTQELAWHGVPQIYPKISYRAESYRAAGDAHHGSRSILTSVARRYGSISTTPSISTGRSNGSSAMPTALRACAPRSVPNSSRIRSEKPLITIGCWLKPGAELTMPNTRVQARIRSRSPSSRSRLPRIASAVSRAAL